ncbi:hypothetical protein GGI35DRAFT_457327 [Trichoderma velutinum]
MMPSSSTAAVYNNDIKDESPPTVASGTQSTVSLYTPDDITYSINRFLGATPRLADENLQQYKFERAPGTAEAEENMKTLLDAFNAQFYAGGEITSQLNQ